jgi:hypothetical protein
MKIVPKALTTPRRLTFPVQGLLAQLVHVRSSQARWIPRNNLDGEVVPQAKTAMIDNLGRPSVNRALPMRSHPNLLAETVSFRHDDFLIRD